MKDSLDASVTNDSRLAAAAALPQDDPNPAQRKAALARQQQRYQYSHDKLPGIAVVNEVPQSDKSLNKFAWSRGVISLLLRVRSNQSLQEINEQGLSLGKIWRLLTSVGLYRLLSDRAEAGFWLRQLRRLLSVVQKIQRLFGRQPKSEDIETDAKAGKTDLVEGRIEGIVTKLQKPTEHLEKVERIKQPSKLTPLQAARSPEAKAARSVDSLLVDLSMASISDYQALFKIYDDLFQLLNLPCISKDFYQDKAFAAQRVAGANPLVIEKVESMPPNFPVTEAQFQSVMGEQDSLARAGDEGRLYVADYAVLDGIKTSHFPGDQKYVCAPLALFAVPNQDTEQKYRYSTASLVPVAIQCQQKSGPSNPIFTPQPAGTPQSQKWSWMIAKTIVQIADGNYHELISHLGRTHLLIESFAIATERQLAPNHPVGLLLRPHFEGTLFINSAALTGLINQGGTVDKVLGGSLPESLRLTAQGVQGYPFSFNDSMVPKTFASRGVDNVAQLPDYPYRDDALLIWEAIHQWVADYLALYYDGDDRVLKDSELQNWLADLTAADGGNIQGIGESMPGSAASAIATLAYLTDALTLVIFTSSAQHAAVNFPQASLMTYSPNMPLAGYRPAPTMATGATAQDYLNLLPPLDQAEVQMNMTYPLGSLYYTRLGSYCQDHFADPKVKAPLQSFQRRLAQIEIIIDQRNAERPTFYNFLHPDKIPQSINI